MGAMRCCKGNPRSGRRRCVGILQSWRILPSTRPWRVLLIWRCAIILISMGLTKRAACGETGSLVSVGPSASKRARAKVEKELYDVQLELQLLDERCAKEQVELQRKYDNK